MPATETSSSTSKYRGAKRRTRVVEIRSATPIIPNAATIRYNEGQPCPGRRGEILSDAKLCLVIVIESITLTELLPSVIGVDGEKEAVAPAGSPETVNVTGLANAPFEGATVRLKLAGLAGGDGS
jgi:hypothetical protein